MDKINKQSKQGKWVCLEEMPDYYPMMASSPWNIKRANDFLSFIGLKNKFKELMVTYENNICGLFCMKDEFDAISKETVKKITENPSWGQIYIDKLIEKAAGLVDITEELREKNLKKLSNKELYKIYDDYYSYYEELHHFHWIQTVLDFGDSLFSKFLMNYLEERIKESKNKKYPLGEVFSTMTTPLRESKIGKEYKDLIEIFKYIHNNPKINKYFKETETRIIVNDLVGLDKKLDKMIADHAYKYGWIGYVVTGPCWGKDYFIDLLASFSRQGNDSDKLLKDLEEGQKNTEKKQKEFEKIFNIDEKHKDVFKVARGIVFTKGERKDSMFFSYSVIENLFKEIGRRYYLSVRQVRYMYPNEFKKLLLENKVSAEELNERFKFSVYCSVGDYDDDKILTGDMAKKFLDTLSIIKEDITDVKILNGDCASPGRAKSEVTIVNVSADIENMKEGNILVSVATNPDLVPAIKKASAIVTDAGGITCHAAIISRELNIPCVVGTKIATKVLKNGYVIDVDATHGKIVIIKK